MVSVLQSITLPEKVNQNNAIIFGTYDSLWNEKTPTLAVESVLQLLYVIHLQQVISSILNIIHHGAVFKEIHWEHNRAWGETKPVMQFTLTIQLT